MRDNLSLMSIWHGVMADKKKFVVEDQHKYQDPKLTFLGRHQLETNFFFSRPMEKCGR